VSLLLTFNDPAGKTNLTPGYFFDIFSRLNFVKGIDGCGLIPESGDGAQPCFMNSLIASALGISCVLISDNSSLLLELLAEFILLAYF
jgi:hypothetical protein